MNETDHRPVDRAAGHAGRRHPRRHAVPVRQPRRVPDREEPAASISASRAPSSSAPWSATPSRYQTGSPWLGVLAAGLAGTAVRRAPRLDLQVPAGQRRRHRHRHDAVRHGPRLLLRQALHPALGADAARRSRSGFWSDIPQVRSALDINALFLVGVALAFAHVVGVRATPGSAWSCACPATAPTPRAPWATRSTRIRLLATAVGGFLAGVGGAYPVALLPRQLERAASPPARA